MLKVVVSSIEGIRRQLTDPYCLLRVGKPNVLFQPTIGEAIHIKADHWIGKEKPVMEIEVYETIPLQTGLIGVAEIGEFNGGDTKKLVIGKAMVDLTMTWCSEKDVFNCKLVKIAPLHGKKVMNPMSNLFHLRIVCGGNSYEKRKVCKKSERDSNHYPIDETFGLRTSIGSKGKLVVQEMGNIPCQAELHFQVGQDKSGTYHFRECKTGKILFEAQLDFFWTESNIDIQHEAEIVPDVSFSPTEVDAPREEERNWQNEWIDIYVRVNQLEKQTTFLAQQVVQKNHTLEMMQVATEKLKQRLMVLDPQWDSRTIFEDGRKQMNTISTNNDHSNNMFDDDGKHFEEKSEDWEHEYMKAMNRASRLECKYKLLQEQVEERENLIDELDMVIDTLNKKLTLLNDGNQLKRLTIQTKDGTTEVASRRKGSCNIM